MKKKEIINFAPEGVKSVKRLPSYVGFIILACAVVFVLSGFVIFAINDFDMGKTLGVRRAETTAAEEETLCESTVPMSQVSPADYCDTLNFLVLCSDGGELTFCQLVCVSPTEGAIKIKPVSLDFSLDFPDGSCSLGEAFGKRSFGEISEAFAHRKIPVCRYLHITEKNFVRMMQKLGSTPINVGESCEFNVNAVKYTFGKGVQSLTSDILIKYMKFAASGERLLRVQADAVRDIFEAHFTRENFDRGEDMFASLINFADSNITAFDYNAAKNDIHSLLASGVVFASVK